MIQQILVLIQVFNFKLFLSLYMVVNSKENIEFKYIRIDKIYFMIMIPNITCIYNLVLTEGIPTKLC